MAAKTSFCIVLYEVQEGPQSLHGVRPKKHPSIHQVTLRDILFPQVPCHENNMHSLRIEAAETKFGSP